nr:MAG TPA: hypothetical protein [Caudoviricetes sp.]
MRLPCHTVGRASVSRSVIQRRQLCQQGLAAGGFVHPLHHPGGGRLCREAHRLLADDVARRLGALLRFLLRPALLAVHGLGGSGGIALFLGSKGIAQLFENIIHRGHVVFIQTQTGGCARTEDRVDTVHRNAGLCTHVVAQTDAAAMEAFGLGCIPGLHLLLRVLKTVKIVGVQHREIEILSTNNHVLSPFVGPCSGAAPEKPVSRHKKSPLRAERGKLRGKSASGGGIVELVRDANALDVAGKGGRRTGGASHVAGHDQGAGALLALAGAQAEIDVRHNDIAAGAVLDLVGEQEILERIADAAVAVDRQGALGGALGVGGAGADEGVGVGGGVQRTAVLLDVVGADDPGVFLGLLGALGLDGKDKVICRLNASVGRTGRDAGLGNGFCYGHSKTPFIWAGSRSGAAASASGSCPRCW